MSNILNHNRLPLECKLTYKDYWDFCLRIGREYYGFPKGLQTECLSAFIDTTFDNCLSENGCLVSMSEYPYEKCVSNGVTLENFGYTGMDNGFIKFEMGEISDEQFENLYTNTRLELQKGDCRLKINPVDGNNGIYSYENTMVDLNGIRCAKLNGGFYQGFFRTGDGCSYSVLPSDIGNGISLEFELYRKDFENEGLTLNDLYDGQNKGTFFYIGTRAENKWIRYYHDTCSETTEKTETTDLETFDGVQLDEYIPSLVESNNKFLIYSRTCGGTTVLNDTGDETVLVDNSPVEYEDNLFTVFSRKCGGITVPNFKEDYLKQHPTDKYNIYKDLWNNALSFRITDDNRVGYKYIVKDCENENPACSYKIESEYSNVDSVPYAEWTTIHVRILPSGENNMRLMFYVDGRLVLVSKELPKLNLRELDDLSEKQEGVPFNLSFGGGTQGLCDVVYEDFMTFHATDYPLQREFGGTFVGYIKAFRFYSCQLNYNQINQNVNKDLVEKNESKIYCGALTFNVKPSRITIEEQKHLIPLLNTYPNDMKVITIQMLPNITKKYVRIVIAIPSAIGFSVANVMTTVEGVEEIDTVSILHMFSQVSGITICENDEEYNVWYCTYASPTMINNVITVELKND